MLALTAFSVLSGTASAQKPKPAAVSAPNYDECRLHSLYPAGARRGDTVSVEILGSTTGGFRGNCDLVFDGRPGLSFRDVKVKSAHVIQATLVVAPDAPLGRRGVRVRSERCGLTNMIYFTVGRLPEVIEVEPNNEPTMAQLVALPVVVNGRVDPKADFDSFAFDAKKGQRLTAAVLAHALDSHGQYKNWGIVDPVLELLDARGRVVAEAGDTLGLDPLLEYTVPADGRYVARVRLEAYEGFPQAVYRLVLGEVPMATSVFPPGGQRGTTVDVELAGPNIPPGTRKKVIVPADDNFPLQYVTADGPLAADFELPFVRGDRPERTEVEPNATPAQATPLELGTTMNGRFLEPGDADWYRVKLAAGQAVCFETHSQRFLRAPVDTLVEVFDAAGKKLTENDDGIAIDYVCYHDYRPMDSRAVFTPTTAGEYLVRVTDQSGGHGPRSVYRLSAYAADPDYSLFLFPDGVPIWGPGTTASLLVKTERRDGLNGDIQLSVEGLPAGWVGSTTVARGPESVPTLTYPYLYHILTITAPPTAKVGDMHAIRVVGKATTKAGKTIERTAQPLTLYYSSDTGFFRMTPTARVIVAAAQTPWLATSAKTITVPAGGNIEVPVMVQGPEKFDSLDMNVNLFTSGVATGLSTPAPVAIKDGKGVIAFKLGDHIAPGRYGIVAALRWGGDVRVGMPGPCTPLIVLEVTAPPAKK